MLATSYGTQQMAGTFGDGVRRELWGNGPDVPMCSSLNGSGVTVTPVADGIAVSGRWPWASVESGKRLSMALHPRLADAPGVQASLARAATLIDTGKLHLFRSAQRVGDSIATRTPMSMLDRTRLRMDTAYAADRLNDAVQALLGINGAGSLSRSSGRGGTSRPRRATRL